MLTLGNLCLLLGAVGIGLWFWHAHGIRERALLLAEQECRRRKVLLLDGAVAFSRFRWLADAKGRKRLARLFSFEFTVTGEERLDASLALFGKTLAKVEFAPFVVPEVERLRADSVVASAPAYQAKPEHGQVVYLDQWRQRQRTETNRRQEPE
ncbi:DUF3301 domain-containing protein [uncultured Pseudomonas sp.]|uniref:DUF3301 domain-containing protein n=1 Tax=uncultured Pseudomonas sp. TaxID=114707 RepID=UPI0025851CF9|nr:DUF3301 domain-containing protein [uncultured Pseudomonas sp.]